MELEVTTAFLLMTRAIACAAGQSGAGRANLVFRNYVGKVNPQENDCHLPYGTQLQRYNSPTWARNKMMGFARIARLSCCKSANDASMQCNIQPIGRAYSNAALQTSKKG
jgi:hypothetical protein